WFFFVPVRFHFHIERKWFMFGAFTLVLWAGLAELFWKARHSLRLWLILATALIPHISVYSVLLRLVQPWPISAYLLTLPIVGMIIMYVVWRRLGLLPSRDVQESDLR